MISVKYFSKALLCSISFAGAYIFGKMVSTSAPALCLGFFRFFISSLCFLPFISFDEFKKVTKRDWIILTAAGLIGITGYNYFFYTAALSTTSINIALINATIPLMTLCLTSLLAFTFPTSRQFLAFILSFSGVAIVITKGNVQTDFFQLNTGEFLMLFAASCWVLYGILIQNIAKKVSPIVVTFITGLFGLLFLFVFCFSDIVPSLYNLRLTDWLALLYIGAIGTAFSYFLYIDTIKHIGARITSFLVFSTTPIFVALLSFFIEGTLITSWQIIGGLLVLSGLYLNFRR